MRRENIIIIIFCCLLNRIDAHNLLDNGNFEDCSGCPDRPGALNVCKSWSIPNHSSPDLFKNCLHKLNYYDVPHNVNGYQEPHSGNAYVGIVMIPVMNEHRGYREYIQGQLKEELTMNTSYKVTFYISWADYSNYFCDRLGYSFSETALSPASKNNQSKKQRKNGDKELQASLQHNTILPTSDGHVSLSLDSLLNRDLWHKIEFIYRAKGKERYLVLGLFGDNANEEELQQFIGKFYGKDSGKKWKGVYYYIDDITVEEYDFTHH